MNAAAALALLHSRIRSISTLKETQQTMAPPHTLRCTLKPPQRRGRNVRSRFLGHRIINPPRVQAKQIRAEQVQAKQVQAKQVQAKQIQAKQIQTTPFDRLPNELLILIGESLNGPKDVYALVRANRRFSVLLTERLQKLACEDRLLSTTALFYAAAYGNEQFVRLLLQKGTGIRVLEYRSNTSSPRYETIHETPDECCEALFEFVLKEGVDLILEYDHQQFAALRWAVVTEDKALLTVLLVRGANTRLKTYAWYGTGPLHAAVVKAKPVIINFLLDNGFDIETKDFQGYTALQVAVQNRVVGGKGQAMITLLLSRGASLSVLDKNRRTLLHQAAQFHHWGSVVGLLLHRGVPVNARDISGTTALHVAATLGHVDTVSILLGAGADKTMEDFLGDTPFILAIRHRQEHVAHALVEHSRLNPKLNSWGFR